MKTLRRTTAAALGAAALVVGISACGGPPTPPAAGAAAGGGGTASSTTVDPNAPEVNAAGDIPDNQVFVPYTAPDGTYQVSVPEGWARSVDGAAVVFTDKFNSVRIETTPRASAPDVASATADEVPTVAAATPGYQPGQVSAVTRRGGPAVLVTYTATSPPDQVSGKSVTSAVERYEFWRSGQELVVTLSGPQGADNVDPWKIVSDSVAWL